MPSDEQFTFRQRFVIWLVTLVGTLGIRLLGPTIRFTVESEEGGPGTQDPLLVPAVYCFWHRCVFPSTWFFRKRDIAVMTSRSFDGEYIARIIEHFGFRSVRGSSSRGAVRALLGMHTEIEQGRVAAFTIDGPRGPMYVAKPGPVLLARNTKVPIVVYHIALERAWVLNSWDKFMIPKPFTRAALVVSKIMPVGDGDDLEAKHAEMQAALDRVRLRAESFFTAEAQRRGGVKLTRAEVITYIEDFINGTGGKWDWDDFTSCPIADPELDAVRLECLNVSDMPDLKDRIAAWRAIADRLKANR